MRRFALLGGLGALVAAPAAFGQATAIDIPAGLEPNAIVTSVLSADNVTYIVSAFAIMLTVSIGLMAFRFLRGSFGGRRN